MCTVSPDHHNMIPLKTTNGDIELLPSPEARPLIVLKLRFLFHLSFLMSASRKRHMFDPGSSLYIWILFVCQLPLLPLIMANINGNLAGDRTEMTFNLISLIACAVCQVTVQCFALCCICSIFCEHCRSSSMNMQCIYTLVVSNRGKMCLMKRCQNRRQ